MPTLQLPSTLPPLPRFVESLCTFDSDCEAVGNCLNKRVVNTLVGSKKIRLGPCPTKDQFAALVSIVDFYTSRNLPIQMLTLWGAIKGYGLFEERLEADVLDLCALRRYACLTKQVESIYPPGLQVTVFSEDSTEMLLSPEMVTLDMKIGAYSYSLCELVRSLDIRQRVRFVAETDRMKDIGVDLKEYMNASESAAKLVFDYWSALKRTDYQGGASLPEFAALRNMGWKGEIPKCMWDYYFARAQTEKPNSSEEERAWYISLYFGNSFSRYKYGTVAAPLYNGQRAPAIKASFAAYPAGVSEAMKLGRIEYKVRDSKNSSTSTPPWAGYGFIEQSDSDYRVACVSVREYRSLPPTVYNTISINNTSIRADLLSV